MTPNPISLKFCWNFLIKVFWNVSWMTSRVCPQASCMCDILGCLRPIFWWIPGELLSLRNGYWNWFNVEIPRWHPRLLVWNDGGLDVLGYGNWLLSRGWGWWEGIELFLLLFFHNHVFLGMVQYSSRCEFMGVVRILCFFRLLNFIDMLTPFSRLFSLPIGYQGWTLKGTPIKVPLPFLWSCDCRWTQLQNRWRSIQIGSWPHRDFNGERSDSIYYHLPKAHWKLPNPECISFS